MQPAKLQLTVHSKSWRLSEPFVTSNQTITTADVISVEIEADGWLGRGEAAGVDYHGETVPSMQAQIESVRGVVEAGVNRADLMKLLPAGGARNAVDAALWDLEAKRTRTPVWRLAGVGNRAIVTAVTIGIRSIEDYEARARALADLPWLKVKVSADRPLEAIAAVRRGSPSARLIVDPNQAWSMQTLHEIGPALAQLRVDLLEQPVPASADATLIPGRCPVPVCADEAFDTIADVARVSCHYDFVNIKLDKTGGLTAALDLARAAQAAGMRLMVGCMNGGSVAMAPGMVLAQLCEIVDLDGPALQAEDWPGGIVYHHGTMSWPDAQLWGGHA